MVSGKKFKNICLTLAFITTSIGTLIAVSEQIDENVAVYGSIFLVLYGFGAFYMWGLMKKPDVQSYPLYTGVTYFLYLLTLGVVVFSITSYLLLTYGGANYGPKGASFINLVEYYFWTFGDLLPGLDLPDTLGFKPHAEPDGLVARLPILFFRVFVVFGIIASFKIWWSARSKGKKGVSCIRTGHQGGSW